MKIAKKQQKYILIFVYLALLISFACLTGGQVYSQSSTTWQKIYLNHHLSDPELDGIDICLADSSNFYIVAHNRYPVGITLLKINAYGDTLWSRVIDTLSNTYAGGVSSGDGGIVCASDQAATVKFDKKGNQVWKKRYGFQALAYKIMRTFDGNYVICGQYNGWYAMIYKIDSNGNLIWMKNFTNFYEGWYRYIIESNDRNYVCVGFKIHSSNGNNYGLITKLDTAGNVIWEKEYIFNGWTDFSSIDKINMGYIVCNRGGIDSLINNFIKINEIGDTIFSKQFNNGVQGWNYEGMDVKKINDNKYLFCSGGVKVGGLGRTNTKIFITDSLGNIIREAIYGGIDSMDFALLKRACLVGNGEIVLEGLFIPDTGSNFNYAYTIRIDSNLNAPPIGLKNSNKNVPLQFIILQNYPNPFNPSTNIIFKLAKNSNVMLKVYDILGKEVITIVDGKQNAGTYNIIFDGRNFASGTYIYSFIVNNIIVESKKMVILK